MKYEVRYDVIEEELKKTGVSKLQLCKAVGHSHSWLHNLSSREQTMEADDIKTISTFLRIPTEVFVVGPFDSTKNEAATDSDEFYIDYDKFMPIVKKHGYPNIYAFSSACGHSRNWLNENRRHKRPMPEPQLKYICYMLDGVDPEEFRYVEPEPEVIEVPKVDHDILPVSTDDSDFQQWVKDAYMFLHKDNLNIIAAQRESAEQLSKILVEINNNLVRLRKIWEEH